MKQLKTAVFIGKKRYAKGDVITAEQAANLPAHYFSELEKKSPKKSTEPKEAING